MYSQCGHRYPKVRPDLLEFGGGKTALATGVGHPLDSATPLLDKAQFLENPSDHPIAKLRNPLRDVLDGQAERQKSRILDFKAVVKQRDTNRCTPLSIIRMDNSVDDGFAQRDRRQSPAVGSLNFSDNGFP